MGERELTPIRLRQLAFACWTAGIILVIIGPQSGHLVTALSLAAMLLIGLGAVLLERARRRARRGGDGAEGGDGSDGSGPGGLAGGGGSFGGGGASGGWGDGGGGDGGGGGD